MGLSLWDGRLAFVKGRPQPRAGPGTGDRGGGGGAPLRLGPEEWAVEKESLSSGTLPSPGRRRPLTTGPHQGWHRAVLRRPSSSVCQVPATHPLPSPCRPRPPPRLRHAPRPGPGGRVEPRPQPPAAADPDRARHRGLRSRGPRAPTRLGRPLCPLPPAPLGARGPNFPRARAQPQPREKGGGLRSGRAFPDFSPNWDLSSHLELLCCVFFGVLFFFF